MAINRVQDNKRDKPTDMPKEKTTEWEGIGITGSAHQAEEFVGEYDQEDVRPPGADGLTPTSSPGGSMRKKQDH